MREISKTSSIINKITNSKIGKESRKVIKTFSQQILQRQRLIRSGFFEVNWNLLQKVRMSFQTFTELLITELFLQILSSTLAFLIITYQFGQNAD